MQTDVLDVLLYADGMDKNASSDAKMQGTMDQVSKSFDDLSISTKRHVLYNPPLISRTMNQSSPSWGMNGQNTERCKVLLNSPTWEALFLEQCKLTMKSLPDLAFFQRGQSIRLNCASFKTVCMLCIPPYPGTLCLESCLATRF